MTEVGSGAFGIVFRASWRELNVAVKQVISLYMYDSMVIWYRSDRSMSVKSK